MEVTANLSKILLYLSNKRKTIMIQAPVPSNKPTPFKHFIEKIELRCKELEEKGIHLLLSKFLFKSDLLKIYRYLIANQDKFENILNSNSNKEEPFALHISKGIGNRTVQIVQDMDDTFVLILETKKKLANGEKNNKALIRENAIKKTKVCWRIDTPEPMEWKSSVITGEKKVASVKKIALEVQALCKATKSNIPDLPCPLQYSLIGAQYVSKKSKELKFNLYAPREKNALHTVILRAWKNLTEKDVYRMIRGLLWAIQILHSKKLAHQTIQEKNILVFEDQEGYYIRLNDFEHMQSWGSLGALANSYYESPEIRIAYQGSNDHFGEFFRAHSLSYASTILDTLITKKQSLVQFTKSQEYQYVDPSNDMWSLGIIIFDLCVGMFVTKQKDFDIYDHPLIRGLLNPTREQRLTIEQAQQTFYSSHDSLKRKLPKSLVQPKVARFIARLMERARYLKTNELYPELIPYITKLSLQSIYNYLISEPMRFQERLAYTDPSFMHLMAMRIAASQELPRVIQIVEDLDGELVLILETKSKTDKNTKNKNTPIFAGGTKRCKPCWRIDTPQPEEWLSAVAKGKEAVERTIQDALRSQSLCKDTINEMPDLPFPIQYSLIGEPYLHKKTSELKIAIYSPRALNSLNIVIYREWKILTEADSRRITRGLLYAIKIMHTKKLAHQDLHAGNILVFRDLNGMYIKIIDFGSMLPFDQFGAQAPENYEPPELRSAYPENHNFALFYKNHPHSYGAYLQTKLVQHKLNQIPNSPQAQAYQKVNPKGDMFQIGLVLYELYTGIRVSNIVPHEVEAYDNPLIRGLLMANREDRFTIEQAQYISSSYQGSLKRGLPVSRVQAVVARFIATIQVRLRFLQANELYPELRLYITKQDLQTIYEYIVSQAVIIQEKLRYTDPATDLMALRIAKSAVLPRTIQIVQDLKGECVLILETKSKDWRGKKIPSNISLGWKKNKPSWRIDTITPEPTWTTAVIGSEDISKILKYAKNSQLLCKNAKAEEEEEGDLPHPINCSFIGDTYQTKKRPIRQKISIISPRASFDLNKSFTNGKWQNFTAYERNRIARGLLYGIQIIHGLGYVYHDLKPTSILIFEDKRGYYVKLSDFTNIEKEGDYLSSPVLGYEAPETLKAYNRNHNYTDYYKVNNKNVQTYGKFVYDQMLTSAPKTVVTDDEMKKLRKANPKTDMWGLGVLLFEFFMGKLVQIKQHFTQLAENKNELIRGLLQPERDKRLNIEQALALQDNLKEPSLTALNTGCAPQITPVDALSCNVSQMHIQAIELMPQSNTFTPGFNASANQVDLRLDVQAQLKEANSQLRPTS